MDESLSGCNRISKIQNLKANHNTATKIALTSKDVTEYQRYKI